MKAFVRNRFGSPDVLELQEVDKPELSDGGVLVRVRAASVNPADWYGMSGTPLVARVQMGLRKPKSNRLGIDYAGTVEAVGRDVTQFQPGDEVFGGRAGALVTMPEDTRHSRRRNMLFSVCIIWMRRATHVMLPFDPNGISQWSAFGWWTGT